MSQVIPPPLTLPAQGAVKVQLHAMLRVTLPPFTLT